MKHIITTSVTQHKRLIVSGSYRSYVKNMEKIIT